MSALCGSVRASVSWLCVCLSVCLGVVYGAENGQKHGLKIEGVGAAEIAIFGGGKYSAHA